MLRPDIISSFMFEGRSIGVEWHNVLTMHKLPNVHWSQVYAIGNLNGKVPLVRYEDGHLNLPGGTTEIYETIEDTIGRELIEEINCHVTSLVPLGYQKLKDPLYKAPIYQMRVYAALEKIGEFDHDPGGSVIGYEIVDLDEVPSKIRYGQIGERMVALVKALKLFE